MKISIIKDKEKVKKIRDAIKANDGYCPCKIEKVSENKCMCQDFITGGLGACHCGLYVKEEI